MVLWTLLFLCVEARHLAIIPVLSGLWRYQFFGVFGWGVVSRTSKIIVRDWIKIVRGVWFYRFYGIPWVHTHCLNLVCLNISGKQFISSLYSHIPWSYPQNHFCYIGLYFPLDRANFAKTDNLGHIYFEMSLISKRHGCWVQFWRHSYPTLTSCCVFLISIFSIISHQVSFRDVGFFVKGQVSQSLRFWHFANNFYPLFTFLWFPLIVLRICFCTAPFLM